MLTRANILEFQEKGYTILIDGKGVDEMILLTGEKKKGLKNEFIGLTKQELAHLHDEADTLTNYLISEGHDIIHDFGCIVGK